MPEAVIKEQILDEKIGVWSNARNHRQKGGDDEIYK